MKSAPNTLLLPVLFALTTLGSAGSAFASPTVQCDLSSGYFQKNSSRPGDFRFVDRRMIFSSKRENSDEISFEKTSVAGGATTYQARGFMRITDEFGNVTSNEDQTIAVEMTVVVKKDNSYKSQLKTIWTESGETKVATGSDKTTEARDGGIHGDDATTSPSLMKKIKQDLPKGRLLGDSLTMPLKSKVYDSVLANCSVF